MGVNQKFSQIAVIFFAIGSFGCVTARTMPEMDSSKRSPAGELNTEPVLKYITYRGDQPVTESISVERWRGKNGGFSAGGRAEYLRKFYFANTRDRSNSGLRHVACFEGLAQDVKEAFFGVHHPDNRIDQILEKEKVPGVSASQDGKMLGIAFSAQGRSGGKSTFHFRLAHCHSGKSTMVSSESTDEVAAQVLPELDSSDRIPAAVENGFQISDQPKIPTNLKLPRFQLKADYHRARFKETDRPWKGMDIRNEDDAFKFAVLLQKYFYEGMANQDPSNNDMNFIAQKSKRYWCHMPWLNVGPSGREGIHGLTKERDLYPSPTMKLYSQATPGTDWGVGYYNALGCQTIGKMFGSDSSPKAVPDFTYSPYPDGTVSAKILFTTADFPTLEGAYTWNANVSKVGSNSRSVRTVRHLQMDIAVKDSTVVGTNAAVNHWVMLTYYYDPSYDADAEYQRRFGVESPLSGIRNLPLGLKKMRPMGTQPGMGAPNTGDTILFAGAETNNPTGRLNGPADNPKSSCMSCHGVAGTSLSMVPGFVNSNDYRPYVGRSLDFSHQAALAKGNYETSLKKSVRNP